MNYVEGCRFFEMTDKYGDFSGGLVAICEIIDRESINRLFSQIFLEECFQKVGI